jgi:hypothetical protein
VAKTKLSGVIEDEHKRTDRRREADYVAVTDSEERFMIGPAMASSHFLMCMDDVLVGLD